MEKGDLIVARPSKLSEKQWADIEKRMLDGEKPAAIAKEYGIDRAQITRKFSQQLRNVKDVANQIFKTDVALKALPVSQQVQAINLADHLKSISNHLAGAASQGAMTAHRLSQIANNQAQKLDDAGSLEENTEVLKSVIAMTKGANDAAQIGLNLLAANKEAVAKMGAKSHDGQLKELSDAELTAIVNGTA